MKKVLSLVLVIAMVLSSMSFAFAGTFTDVADTDYDKAINTLVGLGVVTGYEDGTYRPEKVVTRAEMAKLIVEILGYGDLVAGSKSNFADTQGHWADAWIALAAGRGLVVGTGDGKFTPDRTVSYDEAITMVVRALGYTDASNELKNMTWPTNFKVKAAELGLTKDVKLVATGADRGGVAQLLFNALTANMVTINTDGDVVYQKNGEVNKVLLHSLALERTITVAPNMLDEDSRAYRGDIVDLAPYMYQKVKVYVTNDKDEYVVYVAEVESDVLVGEFRKTSSTTDGKVNVRIDGKNKAYNLASTTTAVFYNGVEVRMNETNLEVGTNPVNLHKAQATFVLDANDNVTAIVANKYTDVVRVSSEYKTGKTVFEGFKLPLNDDDKVDFSKLTITGVVEELEDVQEDDILVLFAGAGVRARNTEAEKLTIEVVRNAVEGKVTREDDTDLVYHIDGVRYALSVAPGSITGLDLGDEGVFYLDQKGEIVDFDGDVAGPTDYAVVVGVAQGKLEADKFDGTKKAIKTYPQLKLATQKDEVVAYDIHTKVNSSGAAVTAGPKKADGVNYYVAPAINDNLTVSGVSAAAKDLIKYSLNDDGRISKIEKVTPATLVNNTDTTKSTFKLASNAIIFDASDDYAVVSASRLQSTLTGGDDYAVYNKNGEIIVLITNNIKAGSVTTFAYVSKFVNANDGKDDVQYVTVYMNGEKVDRYTDEAGLFAQTGIYGLELDGEVITSKAAPVGGRFNTTTATAISARSGMIEVDSAWRPLSADATVLKLNAAGTAVDRLGDLYDITAGSQVTYYLNTDNEVAFITFR